MTVFAETYRTDTPAGSDTPREGDDRIREAKSALQERLDVDHMWTETANACDDSDTGKHRKVTFYGVLADDPTLETGEGALYIKTVSAVSELFWKDSAGTVKQVMSGGKLNVSAVEAVLLAGNQTIAGTKTFSSPPVSATNPTSDNQVANKSYVDAQIAALDLSGTAFGSRTVLDSLGNALALDSVYRAAGDGFLVTWSALSDDDILQIYGGATVGVPETLAVCSLQGFVGASWQCLTAPVPKDYYIKITSTGVNTAITWLPIGAGGLVKQ